MGGSVSAELLHQQLDLVTGIAAQGLESLGEAIVPKPAAHATRLGISAEQLLAVC
jgi:hypothetical protein